ncbi:MAG TPA: DinB family protein [Candidatus Limnocylindrales bacterium]|nr:DinB family protein [Candidatus Limnocylindrales bacterium]
MDERLGRIGRYAAVARGLEREGAYNAAKLLRAAMIRELVRYAEAEAPAGAPAAADALAALVADPGATLPPALMASLRPLPDAVREGRTISLAEAPRVRVCRVCGELFLGDDVPGACPYCEAPALSFHEELPTWYLGPADRGAILAALAAGPRHLALALHDRADEDLARPPAPGEWSAVQALEHLLYSEELLAARVDRLLTEDEPDLAAAAVWAATPASDEGSAATGESAATVAARVSALRHATVTRLAGLAESDWGRGGNHPEWGRVTVLSQAAYFARHEASHLAQLVAAAEGRLPGREA